MFHQCTAYFLLTFECFTGEQLLPWANHCTKIFNFFSKYLRITILIGLSKKISKKKKFKVPIDKGLILTLTHVNHLFDYLLITVTCYIYSLHLLVTITCYIYSLHLLVTMTC